MIDKKSRRNLLVFFLTARDSFVRCPFLALSFASFLISALRGSTREIAACDVIAFVATRRNQAKYADTDYQSRVFANVTVIPSTLAKHIRLDGSVHSLARIRLQLPSNFAPIALPHPSFPTSPLWISLRLVILVLSNGVECHPQARRRINSILLT